MRIAILSDVHANLEALDRVLADARRQGAEAFACLGDIVGYGPLPAQTLARARETFFLTVAGNHDDAVAGRGDTSAFIDLAGDAVARHRSALGADGLAWLRALPYTATCGDATLVHGDLTDPAAFNYIETESDAAANFDATDAQLVFVGHTHAPCIFLVGHSGTVYRTNPQDFTLEEGKRYIVNPGTVGYPRATDGRCESSYVIYDSDERTVRFRFLPFAVSSVMQRGRDSAVSRRMACAIVLLLVALLGAGGMLLLRTHGERREIETQSGRQEIGVTEPTAAVVEMRELALDAAAKGVSANLRLGRRSCPVTLRLAFFGTAGEMLGETTDTVKTTKTKRVSVPAGAVRAVFTVLRMKPEDEPVIDGFAPAVRQSEVQKRK